MKSIKIIILTVMLLFAKGSYGTYLDQSIIDSCIADGVRQIIKYHEALNNTAIRSTFSPAPQPIVIDMLKWCPADMDTSTFYYRRPGSGKDVFYESPAFINAEVMYPYHLSYNSRPDYLRVIAVHLENFPFVLQKPVTQADAMEPGSLYKKLVLTQKLSPTDWYAAVHDFQNILATIAESACNILEYPKIVIYGFGTAVGNYNTDSYARASFAMQYVYGHNLSPNDAQWFQTAQSIPKNLTPPIVENGYLQQKNNAIALLNFIKCNVYNDCELNTLTFSNRQAQWLVNGLKDNPAIDKPKLLSTAITLNGLSEKSAWCVLTLGNEQAQTASTSPLGVLYSTYDNNFLQFASQLASKAARGVQQLKNNANITRDSVLYYGWILYRDEDYIKSLPTAQRVILIAKLLSAQCADVTNSNDRLLPDAHCENIVLSLIKNIKASDQSSLMGLLKQQKLFDDISFRIDNSTAGFFGKDNYTDVILTLAGYWRNMNGAFIGAASGAQHQPLLFMWDEDFFNDNNLVAANLQNNTITVSKKNILPNNSGIGSQPQVLDIYAPVIISPKNNSEILGVPAGTAIPAPAFMLDWLVHIKNIQDLQTASKVTIGVLALATGVGELITATSWVVRGIAALETTVAASDLLLMNTTVRNGVKGCFATPQEGEDFLKSYENITLILNGAAATYGLTRLFKTDVQLFHERYTARKTTIDASSAVSADAKAALNKLDDAIVDGKVGDVVAGVGNLVTIRTNWLNNLKTLYGPFDNSNFKPQGLTPAGVPSSTYAEMLGQYSNAIDNATKQSYLNDLIKTGSTIPIKKTINVGDELYKIVPKDEGITAYTPFFMTKAEFDALENANNIEQKLGLPLNSHAVEYDVYKISATQPTIAFESTIANTIEKTYTTTGGGKQMLVIDRSKWSSPVKVKTIIPPQ